jgi:hypothetical protein
MLRLTVLLVMKIGDYELFSGQREIKCFGSHCACEIATADSVPGIAVICRCRSKG